MVVLVLTYSILLFFFRRSLSLIEEFISSDHDATEWRLTLGVRRGRKRERSGRWRPSPARRGSARRCAWAPTLGLHDGKQSSAARVHSTICGHRALSSATHRKCSR